jgi:hypothetical protein
MPSIYANQVQRFGHGWYWPWLTLLLFLTFSWALHSMFGDEVATAQVVCEQVAESKYQAAVEIDGLFWTGDINAALACGFKHDRQVLIAFHGVTDVNARINEVKVFREPNVQAAMKRYIPVMLYSDLIPKSFYITDPDSEAQLNDAAANADFEQKVFNTLQEPLYAVLQPTEKGKFRIVGEYAEARIYEPARFISFLRHPRAGQFGTFLKNARDKLISFFR